MAAFNVDRMSLKELVVFDAKLKAAIEAKKAHERSELKLKMAELAETHGFSVAELFGTRDGRKSNGVAKYANPEDKLATWTGRGRKPNWLVARLKKGAKLADFEV